MSNYASAAKPVSIGGGVSVAPVGTALPTSTAETLNQAFTALGYISTDGVARSRSDSTTEQKVWGGPVVATTTEGYTETVKLKVVDLANVEALAMAYGDATGSFAEGITVKSGGGERPHRSIVVDAIGRDNAKLRTVIPDGVVTALGDRVYKDNELVGCEMTITAIADSTGHTVYEYIKQGTVAAASSGTETTGTETGGETGGDNSGGESGGETTGG